MKGFLLFLLLFFKCNLSFSQIPKSEEESLYDKYFIWEFTENDLIEIAHKVNWVLQKGGAFNGSISKYEKALIGLCNSNPNMIESIKMNRGYYCSKSQKSLYQRYNKSYKPVSIDVWDRYCSVLVTLIRHDESV